MIKQLKTLVLAIGLVAGLSLASTSFAAKPKEAAPAAAAAAPEAAAPAEGLIISATALFALQIGNRIESNSEAVKDCLKLTVTVQFLKPARFVLWPALPKVVAS